MAFFVMAATAEETNPSGPYVEGLPRSLQEKLTRSPHPQFGAGNWDILDYPQLPKGSLRLQNIRTPGEFVDVDVDLAGKIVVLAEIDVSRTIHGTVNTWAELGGIPQAVETYQKLFDAYSSKGVAFVAVWRDTKKKQSAEAHMQAAADYALKYNLPGLFLLDEKGSDRKSKGAYYNYVDAHIPGHTGGGMLVCIRNDDGKIVYRGYETPCIGAHTTRLILDRLLDAEFDRAVRREFFPEKTRELPTVKKRADGLAYVDDFESYENDRDFKLAPCWGFTYAKQSRMDIRPGLSADAGRGGSKAIHANVHTGGSSYMVYGLHHRFPAPLTDGYVRFFLRRKPASVSYRTPQTEAEKFLDQTRTLSVRFGQPGTYLPAGLLFATGPWGKETFRMDFRTDVPGTVAMANQEWQEIRVTCAPGKKAKLTVDGVLVGDLDSEAVDFLAIRHVEAGKEFYIDDVELFYRGDADHLLTAHQAARPKSICPVEPFTDEEAAALLKKFEMTRCGTKRVDLPAGAIPRADIAGWSHPFVSMDHPLEIGSVAFADLRSPGTFVNPIEKYKGKVVFVCKTGMDEGYMRKRTFKRSPTVFLREDRLLREYRPKGVIGVGLAAADGGHRSTVHSFIDRALTATETPKLSESVMAELDLTRDDIIYGTFPDMFDEFVGEGFPNQARLWKKVLNGRLIDGSFGGPGVSMILDRQGRIVWRGAGPDGHTYWPARVIFDRLLDEKFDVAFRQEFRNPDLPYYKSSLLPKQEEAADGLYYRDDFESYEDAYEFGLQPRWGFTYSHSPSAETPAPFVKEGRNGSTAVLVNNMWLADVWCGNGKKSLMMHEFPAPLRDGYFRFFIRRGPHVNYHGAPPLFRIAITCIGADGNIRNRLDSGHLQKMDEVRQHVGLGSDGNPLQTLTTFGGWEKETFGMTPTFDFLKWSCYTKKQVNPSNFSDSGIAMAQSDWQEVKVVCQPGQNVQILIDGKLAGELKTDVIKAVQLRGEVWSGTYVDDAELFYKGNAGALKAEHAEALKADLLLRLAEWKQEADIWARKVEK